MTLRLSDDHDKLIETWEVALEPRDGVYDLSRSAACYALIAEIREELERQQYLAEQGGASETAEN